MFFDDTSESTTSESTIVDRYQTKPGDLGNNENLKVKYFSNELTRNDFTLFTNLPPNSIFT